MEYKIFGVMLDCSRNAVMKVSEVKRFIDYISKMGYNALELYTEDTFEVIDEPYFGYLRGRYSIAELREIDAYAQSKKVELIPCIQTLAHFTNLVKLPQYASIIDVDDILLIDEPKTYELIEKIFVSIKSAFSSNKINIGMDEAHMVGLGKYLDKHGFNKRFDILLRHLNKVVDIAHKHGLTPHMWSDMFFRLANNGQYYAFETEGIDKSVIKEVPEGLALTFWDYYHQEKHCYDNMLSKHKEFGKEIWFAGGAWSWYGFTPQNEYSLMTMKPAMQSVREHNIEHVLITMWGDNGKECSFFGLLPALYSIRRFADGEYDEQKIKEEFNSLFGLDYDSFMLLDKVNAVPAQREVTTNENPCKAFLYTDCFMNSYDKTIDNPIAVDYPSIVNKIKDASKKAGEFSYVFDELAALANVLDIKATISKKAREAYESKDKNALLAVANDLAELEKRLTLFHEKFYTMWHKENKTFGWEIQDARIGGLIQRAKTCKRRIEDYLNGYLENIEELEVELLAITKDKIYGNNYSRLISTSSI